MPPPLALDFITIKGFKSIASIEKLELRSINLLIGANGSGKSNFIEAFALLHAIREGRLQHYVRSHGGAEQLLHFGSRTTKQIELAISFRGGLNRYEIILQPSREDSLFVAEEEVSFWRKQEYAEPYTDHLQPLEGGREAGISSPKVTRIANWVRLRLALWRVYHVHDTSDTSPMRRTAQIDDNRFLRSDAANLPAFLWRLQRSHPVSFQLIEQTVQQVAPFFDGFSLEPDPINPETIRLSWKHASSDKYFGASALSDGTLRFIALATLFLQPEELRPSVILVDEPELGLHPSAITLLAALVRQASTSSQVILSTQSSLLLDHFDPEDVLVAERRGGGTTLQRLSSSGLEKWLEEYSLGQLWEKNELGGRPSPNSNV